MKIKYAIVVAAVLSGCASAPAPVSSQEKDARRDAWSGCVISNLDTVDDHVSDASTIAVAVAQFCHQQYTQLASAYASDLADPYARLRFMKKAAADEASSALPFVLIHRNKKSGK